jgi:hypothetical protein
VEVGAGVVHKLYFQSIFGRIELIEVKKSAEFNCFLSVLKKMILQVSLFLNKAGTFK